MALAFMLNPARRGRKKARKARRGRKKARTAAQKRWAACQRAASGRPKAASRLYKSGAPCGEESMSNPRRRKRRGAKGGRSNMAKTKRRKRRAAGRKRGWTKAKRRRAGLKSWRKRLRKYPKKRSSVGRRGYKNNPRRKRRRNPLAIRGGMYSNPRRKRRKRRNPLAIRGGMYSNPRRKRRKNPRRGARRRNPFNMGGTLGSIKRRLTDPNSLMQFAAAAAGGTVSMFAGSWLSAKIKEMAPTTFTGTLGTILDAAASIAAAVILGGFLPARFQTAFILGGGAAAAKPLVDMALAPALAKAGEAAGMQGIAGPGGIGAWISVGQARHIGMSGMGGRGMAGYITAQQMANGFRGMGNFSFDYGTPVGSLRDYSGQPNASAAFTM